jgi:alpha/beta superfamily hydrolase
MPGYLVPKATFPYYKRNSLYFMSIANIRFYSGSIALEGDLFIPKSDTQVPGVVLCHPHPLHGGDMRNNVITGIFEAIAEKQIAVLAFNFRGVGNSEGSHSYGSGELDDALAALKYLTSHPEVYINSLAVCGYSFGASIALKAATNHPDIRAVASVACPIKLLNDQSLHHINIPKLFIQGDEDAFAPVPMMKSIINMTSLAQIKIVSNTDHFLHGKEQQVGDSVTSFLNQALR